MRERKYKITKKTLLGVVFVSAMLFSFISGFVLITQTPQELSIWDRAMIVQERLRASATEGEGGSVPNGQGAIVNWYIYPYQADVTTYNAGLSEASAYEHFDASFSDGEQLEGETPHSTAFDIVIEYQFNNSQAYNSTSASWDITLVDAYFNESELSISSQIMEKSDYFFENDTTVDSRINFFLQDADGGAGTGFTIGQLEDILDSEIKVYYYA